MGKGKTYQSKFGHSISLIGAVLLGLAAILGLLHLLSPAPPTPALAATPDDASPSAVPAHCEPIEAHVMDDTTWDQPCYHIMTNTVMVAPGKTLTVSPPLTGTSVYFRPGSQLQIEGNLQVLGTPSRPVTLTADDPTAPSACGGVGTWIGIIFEVNSVRNRVQHAVIEYACTAIAPSGSTDPADGDAILSNTLRYNGGTDAFHGAIGGDIDYTTIAYNDIYSSSHGIVLNEGSHNTITHNAFHEIDGTCLHLKSGGTGGGNHNTIAHNTFTDCGAEGVRLEDGADNVLWGNALHDTLNAAAQPGGAVTLLDQDDALVRYNDIYSNGGGSGYRAGLYITGTSTVYSITHNVLYEAAGLGTDNVLLGPDVVGPNSGVPWPSAMAENALCAASGFEARNATAHTLHAPGTRWGRPHPNAPSSGSDPATHNVSGAVTFTPWISLSLHGSSATGLVTVMLRDAEGRTVPAHSPAPGAPDARRVRLASNWGTLTPDVVHVDDAGIATSQFQPGSGPAPDTIVLTAWDVCDAVATGTLGLPDVVVTKTTALTQATPGSTITYTLHYRNMGDDVAPDVTLTDTLPAGTHYVADTAGLPCAGCTPGGTGPLVWTVGDLTADSAVASFDLVLAVEAGSACGAQLVNAATIGTPALERDRGNNASDAPAIDVVGADLQVTKTAAASTVAPGGLLTYTLAYRNAGLAPALAVALDDELPAHATYVTDTAGLPCVGCTPGGAGPLTWSVGELPADSAQHTFHLVLQTEPAVPPGPLTNTARITTTSPECDPTDNVATAVVRVQGGADLVLVKDDNIGPVTNTLTLDTADVEKDTLVRRWTGIMGIDAPWAAPYHRAFAFEGDVVTYTIAVVNAGNQVASNVLLTETLPLYTQYVGHGWHHVGGRTYVQAIGTLLPGEGAVRYFVVRVDEPLPEGITNLDNVVCGRSDGADIAPDDNCNREDTPVLRRPQIDKTFLPRFAVSGWEITFTLAYSNPNPVPLSDVRITDTLPVGTHWISDTALAQGWTARTDLGTQVAWFTPTLAANAQGHFELTVSPLDACDLTRTNAATLTVRNAEADAYFADWDLVTFTVACPADLVVVKDDSVGPTTPWAQQQAVIERQAEAQGITRLTQHRDFIYEGDTVTYTIAVENVGPYTATNVVLTETLPLYTEYLGHGWTPAGGRAYITNVGTLVPGDGALRYFVVRADDPIPETVKNLVNLVCAWGQEPDATPDDNCNYEDTPIKIRPLHIAKSAPRCISPGDVFDYTPWYTNTSYLTTYHDVPLTDTLDTYVVYAGAAGGAWTCDGRQCQATIPQLLPRASGHEPVLRAQLLATVPYTTHPVITNTIEISGGRRYVLTRTIDTGPDLAVVKNDNIGPLPWQQQALWDRLTQGAPSEPTATQRREYVRPGEEISYTIVYVNDGYGPAPDVVLTEHLPLYTEYAGGGWHHVRGRIYTMAVGSLMPGEGGEVHFYARVTEPFPLGEDRVINEVTIETSVPECNLANNRSDDDTPVRTNTLLYVANRASATIDVFRTTDFSYLTSFYAGPEPFGMDVYEDQLYVVNAGPISPNAPNTVSIVGLHDHQLLTSSHVGYGPLYLTALNGEVFVTNHNDGGEGITVLDHPTGYPIARLYPNQPMIYDWGFFGITSDPTRQRVYATKRYMGGEGLWVVTPGTSYALTQAVSTGTDAPYSTVYNPTTDQVYVTFPHLDELRVYDAATFALVDTYATQQQALSPTSYDGGKGMVAMGPCVYNANFAAHSVSVLAEGPCYDWSAETLAPSAVPEPAPQPSAPPAPPTDADISNGTIIIYDHHIYLPLLMRRRQPYPHIVHVHVGGRPKGLAAGGGIVFVTLPEQNRVAVLDASLQDVRATFETQGQYPHTAVLVYDAPWGE